MHIPIENTVLEAFDPITRAPCPPGVAGAAAVTDLNNFSMPRIRYAIGDVVALTDAACPCGKPHPVIAELSGREDALLLARDGTLAHGHAFSHMARQWSLCQWQLVQDRRDHVTLRIVREKNADHAPEEFAKAVSEKLDLPVDIREVPAIEAAKSGKYRYTIREFTL